MSDHPGLSTEQLGAYFLLMEVGSLLRYAVRRLLFEPMAPGDLTALTEVLSRVREHMRAAPPRSARPRPPRNRG